MVKKIISLFTLLILSPILHSQNVSVFIPSAFPVCNPGDCTSLEVLYTNLKETTSYQVSSMPYNPPFGTSAGTATNLTLDDRWSGIIDLKGITPQDFNFCFFGQTYKKILISTNGAITFSIAGEIPNGFYSPNSASTWIWSGPIPYAGDPVNAPFKNSINGVFQDTNPAISNAFAHPNINYYTLGSYPNRVFVVNYNEVAQFQCDSNSTVGAQTSQILLHETTNVIDVYIQRRVPCTSWFSGDGVVGIQNQDGTAGLVPPGRNVGAWSAAYEAWRFTPNGNSIQPVITWAKNGAFYSNNNPISVCPSGEEEFTVTVSYPICNSGTGGNFTDSYTVNIEPEYHEPDDLKVCVPSPTSVSFDLTSNDAVILGTQSPFDNIISYHLSQSDAMVGINPISNPQFYSSSGNETIYTKIESLTTGCVSEKNFDLIVTVNPVAPSGSADQFFTNGETLANIELTGTNIQWYDSLTGTNILPASTILNDGITYYASQTMSGCEGSSRIAVTVHLLLGNSDFEDKNLRVFPNPVNNILNLSYSTEISSVTVYNLLGQEVLSKTVNASETQLDMSNLSVGTYIVKANVDGLVKTFKIVKQ